LGCWVGGEFCVGGGLALIMLIVVLGFDIHTSSFRSIWSGRLCRRDTFSLVLLILFFLRFPLEFVE